MEKGVGDTERLPTPPPPPRKALMRRESFSNALTDRLGEVVGTGDSIHKGVPNLAVSGSLAYKNSDSLHLLPRALRFH